MPIDSHSPVEAQALTLADIEKIYETEGAEAADAALCRMRDEREAREAAGIIDPPTDIDNLERLLGDLEVGTGETADEVIENLDELDAAPTKAEPEAVAPAKNTSPAKAEPEPAVVEPTGELDAATEEAIERAEAVAEAYEVQPEGIVLPDPTGFEFSRPKRGESYAATKRRFIKDEAKAYRARRTESQQRWRAAVAAKLPPKLPKPPRFPVKDVTPEMKGRFSEYVSRGDTPLARSLRGRFKADNLIIALDVYLDVAGSIGRDPTLTEFSKAMRWRSKPKAQRAVAALAKVFAEGGFGTDAELAKWTVELAKVEAAAFPST